MATYSTTYSKGQTVWFMLNNKAQSALVKGVTVFDTLTKSQTVYETERGDYIESLLFASKQDLLDTL